jgi:hypothetical protein
MPTRIPTKWFTLPDLMAHTSYLRRSLPDNAIGFWR